MRGGGGVIKEDFKHSLHYGLVFPYFPSIFRWTQLSSPIKLGNNLFPFSHYILQIGNYIPNVPQGDIADSFQGLWFAYAKHHGYEIVIR